MGHGLRPGWFGRWVRCKRQWDALEVIDPHDADEIKAALIDLYGLWVATGEGEWDTFRTAYPDVPVKHRGRVRLLGGGWRHECPDCGVSWTAGRGEQGRITALDYATRHVNFHAS